MNFKMKILVVAAAFSLAGCLTTKVELGSESNGESSEGKYTGLFSGPVETTEHCDNKIAAVTIKRSFFGEDLMFECSDSTTAMKSGSTATMDDGKKKKKRRRKKRRKKKSE